jgi:hypothetical protein
MADTRSEGLNALKSMLPGVIPDGVTGLRDGGIADELGDLSLDHVFGALIALRASDELGASLPDRVAQRIEPRGDRRGDLPHVGLRGLPGRGQRTQGSPRRPPGLIMTAAAKPEATSGLTC